jgi:glycosyltransferase involved in cell wall biosynthesis
MAAVSQPGLVQVAYSLAHGGSERLACDLAIGLRGEFETAVIAIQNDGPLAHDLVAADVPFEVIGRREGLDWSVFPKVYQALRRLKPAVVATHHLMQLIYAGLPARLAGARVVHIEHEHFSLRRRRSRRQLALLTRLCDAVVVPGDATRAFLCDTAGLPPRKVSVIPNAVDTSRFRPRLRASRASLGLPEAAELIGVVARLDPAKDHATLLHAFARVRAQRRRTRLVLVGGGPLAGDLKALAVELGLEDDVLFLGPRRDVHELLPNFDVFVLSSIEEGAPMALLEAMACARPVVATAVGDIPDILHHGQAGRLVRPTDEPAIAQAILDLLAHRERAEEVGSAARRRVESRFTLEASLAGYSQVFQAVAAGTVRRR